MPMKPDKKNLWIGALRSEDYPQTRGALIGDALNPDYDPDDDVEKKFLPGKVGYCCLGVLTDLCIKSGECADEIRYSEHDPTIVQFFDEEIHSWEDFEDGDLPRVVQRWAGIKDRRPDDSDIFRAEPNNPRLGGMRAISRNDDERQSFEEIAAAIENDPFL